MTDIVLRINAYLGYDFNTVELAVRDGVPYAIDFCNPAPDAERTSVGDENFEWVVETAANYAIEKALANKEGFLASNNSCTRGKPPVISRTLDKIRGIFTMIAPGKISCLSSTEICAPTGTEYEYNSFPFSSTINNDGDFFLSRDSIVTFSR